jgi:hypothetical protein
MAATTELILHLVFGHASGKTLDRALEQVDRQDRVLSLWEDLSVGPIEPPDIEARWAWAKQALCLEERRRDRAAFLQAKRFWETALGSPARKVIWVTRRSAQEYCGLLECVRRLGDRPYDVVDLTEAEVPWPVPDDPSARSRIDYLWWLKPRMIRGMGFSNLAAPLEPARRRAYIDLWNRLRRENAAFRVVSDGDLVSKPVEFYDPLLLAESSHRWRKSARVVATVMQNLEEARGIHPDPRVLLGRLRSLVGKGLLESQGYMFYMGRSEVRLPSAASST